MNKLQSHRKKPYFKLIIIFKYNYNIYFCSLKILKYNDLFNDKRNDIKDICYT